MIGPRPVLSPIPLFSPLERFPVALRARAASLASPRLNLHWGCRCSLKGNPWSGVVSRGAMAEPAFVSWDVDRVCEWLSKHRAASVRKTVDAFRSAAIDGKALYRMDHLSTFGGDQAGPRGGRETSCSCGLKGWAGRKITKSPLLAPPGPPPCLGCGLPGARANWRHVLVGRCAT